MKFGGVKMKLNDFRIYTKLDLEKMKKQELIKIITDLSNRLFTVSMYVEKLDNQLNELLKDIVELGEKNDKTNKN